MNPTRFLRICLLTVLSIFYMNAALCCSMYKITVHGKTLVGNNEDSWGRDACIWFEPGGAGKYSVVCVGYARKHPRPDGAMNEAGLVFDAFTMAHKWGMADRDPAKKDFGYADLKTVMQQCKTVDEVYTFFEKLNLHVLNGSPLFNGGMLLFADKSGKYLVVEASNMTFGNDPTFALANFSIADTKDVSTIKTERYCKGVRFLKNKQPDTSLAYCTALSDTMSVHRAKVGDGTLYTNIYDLDKGLIHLYFYHDYTKCVTFNLKEEMAKGPHTYTMASLFPVNTNFQKFLNYKTPQNNRTLFLFIIACGLLFLFTSLFFLISFFRSANTHYKYLKPLLSVFSMALCVYTFVLIRNEGIFYFPAPYNSGHSLFVDVMSYTPFVLLLAFIPLLIVLAKIIKHKKWGGFATLLFMINNVAYLMLISLFVYWKLFDVFS